MKSDITRQVSASVYKNASLRDKFFNFVKDPYHAVIESYGMDTTEVLKHTFNARRNERNYYQILFIPSIIFWIIIFLAFTSGESSFMFGFLAFIVAYVIVLNHDVKTRDFLKANLSKNSYHADFNYNESNNYLISHFQNRTSNNVVFYSGYSPFVGSGFDIGGWSLVVDIDKGKKNLNSIMTPLPFEESELYSAISNEINSLLLPNISVNDKVFINGKKIRNNKDLLPNEVGHPVNNVNLAYIELVIIGVQKIKFKRSYQKV